MKALRAEGLLLLALGLFAARGRPGPRGRFFAAYAALYAFVLFGLAANSDYLSRRHVFRRRRCSSATRRSACWRSPTALGRLPAAARGSRRLRGSRCRWCWSPGSGSARRSGPTGSTRCPSGAPRSGCATRAGWRRSRRSPAIKQRIGYYAGARFVDLRRAPHPDLLLEFLRRERVRYVVVDESERVELLRLTAAHRTRSRSCATRRSRATTAFVFELRG